MTKDLKEQNKIRISEAEAEVRLVSSPLNLVDFQLRRVLNRLENQTNSKSD